MWMTIAAAFQAVDLGLLGVPHRFPTSGGLWFSTSGPSEGHRRLLPQSRSRAGDRPPAPWRHEMQAFGQKLSPLPRTSPIAAGVSLSRFMRHNFVPFKIKDLASSELGMCVSVPTVPRLTRMS
jgi:hypothetical protein